MCIRCTMGASGGEPINARKLKMVIDSMTEMGIQVPVQLRNLVDSLSGAEEFVASNPNLSKEELAELRIKQAVDTDGAALDQEMTAYREQAWALIDLVGNIVVSEPDSTKRWLQVAQVLINKTDTLADSLGILAVLLCELGRQPELVAQIRSANEVFLGE
jgi:hypothetical protein